jgi:hypothetical protein
MTDVFGAGGGPYPYGSLILAVGYVGKPVMFRVIAVSAGPDVVEVKDGKDRLLAGVVVVLATAFE